MAHRFVRYHGSEDDIWSQAELADDGWAVRQVDLQEPHRRPLTAASLTEVLHLRDHQDLAAMQVYEATYGVLAEGAWGGWEDADQAVEITETDFEALWASARQALSCDPSLIGSIVNTYPLLPSKPSMADRTPLPTWRHDLYIPDAHAWPILRPQLHLGQAFPVGGFVDALHLPDDPHRWPTLRAVIDFRIWWIDERPQIRLMPADPRYRREDFTTWIQNQATPAAAAFRAQQAADTGTHD